MIAPIVPIVGIGVMIVVLLLYGLAAHRSGKKTDTSESGQDVTSWRDNASNGHDSHDSQHGDHGSGGFDGGGHGGH